MKAAHNSSFSSPTSAASSGGMEYCSISNADVPTALQDWVAGDDNVKGTCAVQCSELADVLQGNTNISYGIIYLYDMYCVMYNYNIFKCMC